ARFQALLFQSRQAILETLRWLGERDDREASSESRIPFGGDPAARHLKAMAKLVRLARDFRSHESMRGSPRRSSTDPRIRRIVVTAIPLLKVVKLDPKTLRRVLQRVESQTVPVKSAGR